MLTEKQYPLIYNKFYNVIKIEFYISYKILFIIHRKIDKMETTNNPGQDKTEEPVIVSTSDRLREKYEKSLEEFKAKLEADINAFEPTFLEINTKIINALFELPESVKSVDVIACVEKYGLFNTKSRFKIYFLKYDRYFTFYINHNKLPDYFHEVEFINIIMKKIANFMSQPQHKFSVNHNNMLNQVKLSW